jgi:iron complex transport system substrate-binding protein
MRIVSLLASATEMIAALGCLDQLVGRSHECDYPAEVRQLPLVSTVQINTEASSAEIDAQIKQLASSKAEVQESALRALSIYRIDTALLQQLRPDIIFTQTQCEVCAVSERDVIHALQQVTGLQPRIVSLAPYRLNDIWEDFLRVGKALDKEAQARALVASYQERLERLHEQTSNPGQRSGRPRVALLEWLDPLMAAGNWTPELVEYAGGRAVFGEVGQHSPWLSWEELRAADPDVLILSPCGFTLERMRQDLPIIQQHPIWSQLRAVQQGEVYAVDGNFYLNRSGPRVVDSAEILAHILWGTQIPIHIDEHAWEQIQ